VTSLAVNLIPVKNLRPPTTRYRKGVKPASLNMLKRGKQNKKLGDKVAVKMWKGMTMYSLSLEERATCPSDCAQWDNCYGDNMPFAHRFDHTDPNFISYLEHQLSSLNDKHPEGFVVRLHVLGDFYSGQYIVQWQLWLHQFKNMHVFGYTHHTYTSQLGCMIGNVNSLHRDRFRVRFSDDYDTQFSAHVTKPEGINSSYNIVTDAIICPEQQGKTESCTTCGYCWSSDNPIVFIEH
jgi:hypothetical protein